MEAQFFFIVFHSQVYNFVISDKNSLQVSNQEFALED